MYELCRRVLYDTAAEELLGLAQWAWAELAAGDGDRDVVGGDASFFAAILDAITC